MVSRGEGSELSRILGRAKETAGPLVPVMRPRGVGEGGSYASRMDAWARQETVVGITERGRDGCVLGTTKLLARLMADELSMLLDMARGRTSSKEALDSVDKMLGLITIGVNAVISGASLGGLPIIVIPVISRVSWGVLRLTRRTLEETLLPAKVRREIDEEVRSRYQGYFGVRKEAFGLGMVRAPYSHFKNVREFLAAKQITSELEQISSNRRLSVAERAVRTGKTAVVDGSLAPEAKAVENVKWLRAGVMVAGVAAMALAAYGSDPTLMALSGGLTYTVFELKIPKNVERSVLQRTFGRALAGAGIFVDKIEGSEVNDDWSC